MAHIDFYGAVRYVSMPNFMWNSTEKNGGIASREEQIHKMAQYGGSDKQRANRAAQSCRETIDLSLCMLERQRNPHSAPCSEI